MRNKILMAVAAAAFSSSALAVDLPVVGTVAVVNDLPMLAGVRLPDVSTPPLVPELTILRELPGMDASLDVLETGSPLIAPLVAPALDVAHPALTTIGRTLEALP